jgi:hypothetical protein
MEIQLFDLLLLFILAICFALLIGFNILFLINEKLNDIKINVPECPQNQKNHINDTNDTNHTNESEDINEEIEKFSPNYEDNNQYMSVDQKELPMRIIKNNDPSKKPIIIRQGYQSMDQNIGNNITYPAADDIIRYRGPGCYKNTENNDTNKRTYATKTFAKDMNKIHGNTYNLIKTEFLSPSSNDPNHTIQQDIRLYVPRTYMGKDPYISGISYASLNLEIPADIDQIGNLPVNDFKGEPVAINSLMSD